MQDQSQFSEFLDELVGMPIAHVWRGYGSAVFLEIGKLTESGFRKDGSKRNPNGQISLMVEWSWRVQSQKEILFGSWSDDLLWEEGFKQLAGELIADCQLFGSLPEVALKTKSGLEFISFSTTNGQPQWAFIDNRAENSISYSVDGGSLKIEQIQDSS